MILKSTRLALCLLCISLSFLANQSDTQAAEVNILIIGSQRDSLESRRVQGKSQAFSPLEIKTHLEKILKGADVGTANVVLEDRYQRKSWDASYNLASWFHWPYPENVEVEERWPNLRGEKGTKWDYVILIGDPYTMERLPGLYTHGAAKIAEEVAKGQGQTVLLMPWPGPKSEVTIKHYQEIVYRTGRTGGMMVAPAGLAWEAAGKPTGDTHPSQDGAYIAAASIYSRIWKQSAGKSSYKYKQALADQVYQTVAASMGAKHHAGRLNFQNAFAPFNHKSRRLSPAKSPGGSSTENGLVGVTKNAMKRVGAISGGKRFRIGRDSGSPKTKKDYRLGDKTFSNLTFAYRYQSRSGNADVHLGQIFGQDIDLADQVMGESKTYRAIPRRLIWANLHQIDPKIRAMGTHGHISGNALVACGSYIYTMISGRCTVESKPEPVTELWLAQMAGYETAWRLSTGQSRAPGFKVASKYSTVDEVCEETLTVQFMLPIKAPVTVEVSSSSDVASVTPSRLTFAPGNAELPQTVAVKVNQGAKAGTPFRVHFRTQSKDEVCDGLLDSWDYHVNHRPVAEAKSLVTGEDVTKAILLSGSDADKQAISFKVQSQPEKGKVTVDGNKLTFTPQAGATGEDQFLYVVNDGLADSVPGKVTIDIKPRTRYDFNLLKNPSADEGARHWQKVDKLDGMSARTGGTNGVHYFNADGRKSAEIYQDIDVTPYADDINHGKQRFLFTGQRLNADTTHFILEYLDKDRKILSAYDSGDFSAKSKSWHKTKKEFLAPSQTSFIRVRLISHKSQGRNNDGSFDDISLVALQP